MNKLEIIHTISNIVAPIRKTSQFHDRQIEALCDMVYTQKMTTYQGVIDNIDMFTKEYTARTATLDATRNLYYLTLPVEVIPIPKVPSGVRYINTAQGMDLDFAPTTEMEFNYMGGLESQLYDTTILWFVQGSKVWFNESMTSDIAAAGVRIILLPKFREYADTDEINIPGGTALEFVQEVLQLLGVSQPVDLRNNNTNP